MKCECGLLEAIECPPICGWRQLRERDPFYSRGIVATITEAQAVASAMATLTLGAPPAYTGPVRCWQDAIDALEGAEAVEWLRWVKRTRLRMLQVNHDGRAWPVARAELRDYLKQRSWPRWLRSRPTPPDASPTITFRRWVPYPVEPGRVLREALVPPPPVPVDVEVRVSHASPTDPEKGPSAE